MTGCISPKSPNVKYPTIALTPRPQLGIIPKAELAPLPPATLQKLLENDQKLKAHIAAIEEQVNIYNGWAKKNSK